MGIENSDEKLITNFSGLKVCWLILRHCLHMP